MQVCLNPFGTGQCLSTKVPVSISIDVYCLNPFRAGQCLSTDTILTLGAGKAVSIPLEQGNVFRRGDTTGSWLRQKRLNPFRAGQCLSTQARYITASFARLNPFGTGQCLSTSSTLGTAMDIVGLNPFGTGQCLSTRIQILNC